MVFSFLWLSLAYVVVCLTAGTGLDLDAGKEKVLVARLAVLYTVVLGTGLITRFVNGVEAQGI